MISDAFKGCAERASKMAGYYRRAEDYVLQANLATSELEQYGRQIISSLLREQIAKREYDHHLVQIEQAAAADEFLRTKFTNEDLYTWMQGELSKTLLRRYKLAFDVAKKAEQSRSSTRSCGPSSTTRTSSSSATGTTAQRGLLAGEALRPRPQAARDGLPRAEPARTTSSPSTSRWPVSTRARCCGSRRPGRASVEVPEWLFDMDSPGVYLRRLKTVALTDPCVTGPYTGIHCALSLLRVRSCVSPESGDQYARNETADDPPVPRLHRRDPASCHQHRAERQRPVRDQPARRPLPAVRGCRSDQHVAARAAERPPAVRRRDHLRCRAPPPLHGA